MRWKQLNQFEATIGSVRDGQEVGAILHPGIRRLLAALVVRGLRDLDATKRRERFDAFDWWFSNERKWVFSSFYCCQALGLELRAMQDFILANWPEAQERTSMVPRASAMKVYTLPTSSPLRIWGKGISSYLETNDD